ncbi:FMN-dependent NADH-azoreductase [Lactiplantibacillus paraplantarum]|uniref:FMN dependent NADH:quinone oxidoreductase n=1 Tax=Lactiplantibacillus paraplantarum TaxID=60520 RepID=A0AAD0TP91_9LACO|nr:NAD(P)H-dependent oxidoreductase [Lactiplantibacillus paraplantarum]AVW09097.1 FMN-dependent NADH-azoreductase [Lactiplantibacillus paraplantarum]AYJ37363.1 FMN-dependent NADH-azoreductase [Lactiplantibacillus paraplantarum]ERL45383.1 putative acyl carrier protein phosphodiesterase (putative) [Lactiplantibacillus paraplantarum]KRL51073.1 ACP phosphodieterase [Lactiplantibacillus paraplantarum DSM 10667]MCU4682309.1 NAD(P)H-dependent oxidoreductase [Lactiplantibacillus paraplantarum]
MQTLIINAHPDFRNTAHYSIQLEQAFLQHFQSRFSEDTVDIINLYDMAMPQATVPELLGIWEKQAQHVTLSAREQQLFAINQQLLQQFKAHHRIVIAMPLHNFNVPARLKDYIDNILVARETFRYTENGSVGLMTDDYRVMLLQASGSIYTRNDRYTPMEFSRLYLDKMFTEIMGFDQFEIVRAQGLQTQGVDVPQALKQAKVDLAAAFERFYH